MLQTILHEASGKDQVLRPNESYFHTSLATYTMGLHVHGCLEIDYVVDNYCTYYIQTQKHILKKNDLILFNSALPHRLEHTVTGEKKHFALLGMSFCLEEKLPGTIPILELIQNSPVLRSFADDFGEVMILHEADAIFETLKEAMLYSCSLHRDPVYLNTLINKLLMEIAIENKQRSKRNSDYIGAIQDYIRDNYATITGVEEVAGHVCLNKNYLQRIFKQQMGCTLWQYIINLRMQHAAALLRDTEIFIGDIDKLVGINSRQNFYLQFRKTYGISPAEYRKGAREKVIALKQQNFADLRKRFPCHPA